MFDIQRIVDNSENLIEMSKSLQSSKQRYQKTLKIEQEARDEIKKLNVEAHQITTAMANEDDQTDYRSLDEIARELRKAHNRVDKAINKSHGDAEAVKNHACALMELMSGNNIDFNEFSSEGIVITTYDEEAEQKQDVAEAG